LDATAVKDDKKDAQVVIEKKEVPAGEQSSGSGLRSKFARLQRRIKGKPRDEEAAVDGDAPGVNGGSTVGASVE